MCFVGVIIAVLGKESEEDRGRFIVEDYCFQMLPDQISRSPIHEDRCPVYFMQCFSIYSHYLIPVCLMMISYSFGPTNGYVTYIMQLKYYCF